MSEHMLLAIDQGTTSSRAIRFDSQISTILQTAQTEFAQHYPQDGWVEHDAEDIWATTLSVTRAAMSDDVAAIGITNQRETVVIWNRQTGRPIHNAIVWQDRRTADLCATMKADNVEAMAQAKTGLLLDPYFSASKIKWLLDHVDGAREASGVRGAGGGDHRLFPVVAADGWPRPRDRLDQCRTDDAV